MMTARVIVLPGLGLALVVGSCGRALDPGNRLDPHMAACLSPPFPVRGGATVRAIYHGLLQTPVEISVTSL